jgi:hypothetical protein
MKCLLAALTAAALAGCSPVAMEEAADHDEARGTVRAEMGDGYNAARLKQRAADLRESALLREEQHGRLWWEATLN